MALKDSTRAGYPSGAALLALMLVFLLAAVRPLGASPGAEFTVSGSGVALRAQPRETATALLALTPEHLLVEFKRRGDWVRVGVYREVGAFGWVPADQLVPAPRPSPERPDAFVRPCLGVPRSCGCSSRRTARPAQVGPDSWPGTCCNPPRANQSRLP